MYWKVAWYTVYIYINGNYISIYGLLSIRTSILDYLRESFPWPARPFKHTESNSFKHTATTFKYMNSYFILPPGPRGLARPPHIQMLLPYIYICIYPFLLAGKATSAKSPWNGLHVFPLLVPQALPTSLCQKNGISMWPIPGTSSQNWKDNLQKILHLNGKSVIRVVFLPKQFHWMHFFMSGFEYWYRTQSKCPFGK